MKLELSCGSTAILGIRHENFAYVRSTTAHLTVNGLELYGTSRCKAPDNFGRATGRRLAANRLLAVMKHHNLSKADRKVVFDHICPEFSAPRREES